MLLKLYKKAILTFIGDENTFSLEHRIFNLFSFFVCITSFTSFFLNLLFGLYETAILTVIVFLLQSIILYLSRIEKKFKLAVILTGVELHILLVINYFINGGVAGPTTILFLAVLFLMTSIVRQKKILFWLTLNFSTIAVLYYLEYLHPEWILFGYTDRSTLFSDVYASFMMVVVLMATGILYKRRAYNKQQINVETKALALEKLNSEKNKLFSIISHDLRAPIGSVKQYLSFLKDHTLTAEEKKVIERGLIKSTDEAYELLDNLLNWTKTQMAGSKTFITKLSVVNTLDSTISQVNVIAEQKGIKFQTQIDNVEVAGDKDILQLVVRNLLLNAIKFSLPTDIVELKVYKDKSMVIFEVKDSGVGISEENQKTIFSLDVKSSLGTHKEKGTGLGLVLCKEYTQLQNGEIWFDSEVGRGSIFYVSLPTYS